MLVKRGAQYPLESKRVVEHGIWMKVRKTESNQLPLRASLGRAAGITLRFNGRGVRWLCTRTALSTAVVIQLDDAQAQRVEIRSQATEASANCFMRVGLAPGAHTLTIRSARMPRDGLKQRLLTWHGFEVRNH